MQPPSAAQVVMNGIGNEYILDSDSYSDSKVSHSRPTMTALHSIQNALTQYTWKMIVGVALFLPVSFTSACDRPTSCITSESACYVSSLRSVCPDTVSDTECWGMYPPASHPQPALISHLSTPKAHVYSSSPAILVLTPTDHNSNYRIGHCGAGCTYIYDVHIMVILCSLQSPFSEHCWPVPWL